MYVFNFPFCKGYLNPKAIDAQGYKGKKKPFHPQSEQLQSRPFKLKSLSVNNSVLGFPAVYHTKSPGITNPQSESCYKKT